MNKTMAFAFDLSSIPLVGWVSATASTQPCINAGSIIHCATAGLSLTLIISRKTVWPFHESEQIQIHKSPTVVV